MKTIYLLLFIPVPSNAQSIPNNELTWRIIDPCIQYISLEERLCKGIYLKADIDPILTTISKTQLLARIQSMLAEYKSERIIEGIMKIELHFITQFDIPCVLRMSSKDIDIDSDEFSSFAHLFESYGEFKPAIQNNNAVDSK